MAELPRGTVTFLFTDIQGSTRLWQTHHEVMVEAYARHDTILRNAIEAHGGVVYKTIGDALQVAFPTAPDAVAAALAAQQALQAEDWAELGLPEPLRVRMALHTGAVEPDPDGDYRSPVLNRLGRLLGAGHGGQVLLSDAVRSLTRDRLPAGVVLQDLGAHQLKDLLEPEPLHQLVHPDLITDFPPPVTLTTRPHNLPRQLTPFLGREQEVTRISTLVQQDAIPLVTLTGPGGTGKTRLALQAAAEVVEAFPDGVWVVELAALTDPGLVPSAIAAVLGVREEGQGSPHEAVVGFLREKQVLLVLDNLEQLLPTAATSIGDLIGSALGLTVLATSRGPLRLRAEREVAVPPLGLPRRKPPPTLAQLGQYEAVRLFIERAQAVKVDFTVTSENAPAIAEICIRLDGLPLAIELAAARIRMLPPQAMLRRLQGRLPLLTGGARDLPARQQTLRGAIAWSYELLTADEQALFRRLAVFAGGATFEAIEAVAAGDELGLEMFDGLERLIDHSLLRQMEESGDPRFTMLETIREYGLEQLEATGEAAEAHGWHAAYFLALVEEAERAVSARASERIWLDRLETEHDNLRSALTWALDSGQDETALRLSGMLAPFWMYRDHITEGRTWLERALVMAGDSAPAARAKALEEAGYLAGLQGDSGRATALGEQALTIYRTLGDRRGVINALETLANAADFRGDTSLAMALIEEELALARELGDESLIARALNMLGYTAYLHGDIERARPLLEEAVPLARKIGGGRLGTILHSLGEVRRADGDLAGAEVTYREGLSIAWDARISGIAAECFRGLAAAAARDRPHRAARLLGAEETLRESIEQDLYPGERADLEHAISLAREALSKQEFAAAWEAGRALPLEDAVAEALAVADQIAGAAAGKR